MRWFDIILKRRKERQNVGDYGSLVEAPAVADFKAPANARIAFANGSGAIEGSLVATLTGSSVREIRCPDLDPGELLVLDYVEEDISVELESGFDAYLDRGLGQFVKIAEG